MEKYAYPKSKAFFHSNSIKSKMLRYNRNNSSLLNLEKGTNIFKNSYISSPESLKQSIDKRYNINNSPISTKTVNLNNNNNNLKLKIFHENHINLHKKNISSLNPLKDKVNNSIYTTNSRMNKSTKNFYPSTKIDYINNVKNININRGSSHNKNIRYNQILSKMWLIILTIIQSQ